MSNHCKNLKYFLITSLASVILVLFTGCFELGLQNAADDETTALQYEFPFPVPEGEYPSPPDKLAVFAQINDKEQYEKTVTVIFSGGKGQKQVKDVWVDMYRADGKNERFEMRPEILNEIVLQGSSGEDKVRVFARYFDGNTYLIGERDVRVRQRV